MSAGADQPNRADHRRRSVLGVDPSPDERTGEAALGLFDAAPPLRTQRPAGVRIDEVTGPIAGTPVAPERRSGPGTGTHTARASGPDGHGPIGAATPTLTRQRRPGDPVPFRPITQQLPVLPTPPLERVIDAAHRWRTALGLALAALITAGVVIAYQRQGGSEVATSEPTAIRADNRSAVAGLTDFSATDSSPGGPTVSASGDQAVNSAIEETAPSSITTVRPSTSGTTPTTDPTSTAAPATESSPPTTVTTTEPSESTSSSVDSTLPTTSTIPATSESSLPTETTLSGGTTSTSSTTSTTSTTDPGRRRVEAESATLQGAARVRTDQQGYEGTGFVGDLITPGSGLTVTADVAAAGDVPFTVRYAAGPAGNRALRTLTVEVNGTAVGATRMQPTASWDTWDVVVGTLPLVAGPNEITLVWGAGDTGWVNIDYVDIG
ncbi:MAG: CBM35 domain-containing protein [Acidimicrobiales bacterium]